MTNAMWLLVNGQHGQYVPQTFAEDCEGWQGISDEDLEVLEDEDVDNEYYWETWEDVLNNAYYMQDGYKYTLWQSDGGLWAVCPDLMTEEEQEEFFS